MNALTAAEKQRWIDDLLSGKFKQTTNHLRDSRGYCCLGVLATQEYDSTKFNDGSCTYEDGYSDKVYQVLGDKLTEETKWKLINMNDGISGVERKTFPEIVEWIRDNVECT